MVIDHVGYAVKDIAKAKAEFQKLGFHFGEVVNDYDRNVYVCFGDNGACRIEMVSPIDKEAESPVDIYLSKVGPTAYHICYRSDNLLSDIEDLKEQGFRLIIEPKPAIAFSGGGDCLKTHD